MKEYIISDTHFNDDKIINFTGRPFNNISDMDKTIIHNWRDLVTNDDTVYHLGDLSTSYIKDNTLQYIISLLNFKNFILIRGNHDLLDDKDYYKMGITKVYDYPIIIKDFIILSHEPKFLEINSPYCNLYGHTHQNIYTTTKGSTFYYNCCVDVNSFKPILLQYIIDKIQDLYKNNVLKHKFKGYVNIEKRPSLRYENNNQYYKKE
jgi:calcineurin-like phosphoesterase family protein